MSDSHFTTFPLFSEDLGPPSKRCGCCREIKPLTEFSKSKKERLGVFGKCKTCQSLYAKDLRLRSERYRDKVRNSHKFYRRKKRFGIDRGEYERMVIAQGNVCAICGNPPSGKNHEQDLHVDHCHETGQLRMLLCYSCNIALGHFKDDPTLLRKAAEYIERFRDDPQG